MRLSSLSLVAAGLLVAVAASWPAAAAAQTEFVNPLNTGDAKADKIIKDFITSLLSFILGLAGVTALVVIVYAGLRLVLGAALSEQEVARAKQMILWAVVGLMVIGMGAAILEAIKGWLF